MKQSLEKYSQLIKLTLQNSLVYRLSVILWRLRIFLGSLMSLTVWQVIFNSQGEVFNYNQNQMISYIFIAVFLQGIILSTPLHGLAGTIYSGQLSSDLVKPINIFLYLGLQDISDKLKNLFFIFFEMTILYSIFKPNLIWPNLDMILLFLLWAILGSIIYFYISLIFGAIGFWNSNIWGPKFLFFIFLDFTAGRLYPLDILPDKIQTILKFTPFPYLSYIQTQLFLNRLESQEIINYSLILIIWVILIFFINKILWQRGLKDYSTHGQ